jgi:TolB-like protein
MSIAVLPFTNFSDDREQQSFAAAVTEDLTTDLSRLTSFVVSRNLAFAYRDQPVEAKQIGRELGVRYVLEGSVERSNDRVRINVQLIDAATAAVRWAERFDSDVGDGFALQNDITARIANPLSVQLVRAEAARPTAAPDALDYYLRGRAAISKGQLRVNFSEAVRLFERALALDPQSQAIQDRLANALMSRELEEMTDTPAADIARAEGLINQVLTASPGSAGAHFARGQALRAQGRCEEALPEYDAMAALERNRPYGPFNVGRCLMQIGLLDAAIAKMEQGIQLSPHDPFIASFYSSIGQAHLLQGRAELAISWLEKSRSANPGRAIARAQLAAAFGLQGETERAAAELAAARRLSGDGSYASIAAMRATRHLGAPKVGALSAASYLAGLRKAGMPEE